VRAIRLASRASALSLAQVEEVAAPLRSAGLSVEVVRVTSRGDADLRTPLYAMREKGVFEREVDAAVLRGDADAAVHSAKDVPTDLPPGLVVAAVPRRLSPYDAIVAPGGAGLGALPRGARVGTSSLRRISMLRRLRPDLEVVPMRGNLDTRLRAVGSSVDAIISAEAGLERLGLAGGWRRLPPEEFVPAAGQGALLVLAREGDAGVLGALAPLDDRGSRAEVLAERDFLGAVGAGCRAPVGVLARASGRELSMIAGVVPPDGSRLILARASGPIDSASEVAMRLVGEFEAAGGAEAMRDWRDELPGAEGIRWPR
jgi:hydroxymethylbilane synthase